MSTDSVRIDRIEEKDVIVRGFADKPAKLVAVAAANGVVYASRDASFAPLGFHSDDVFAFDDDVFAALSSRVNMPDLTAAWDAATPFVPTICGEW
jgi:hypothetical protein